MKFKRVFLIVLDSLGVGEAIDASNYGDTGACTLGHINENNELFIPNLKKLGFLNTINMSIMEHIFEKAKSNQQTVAFPEIQEEKILLAAREAMDQGICKPLLVGKKTEIESYAAKFNINIEV